MRLSLLLIAAGGLAACTVITAPGDYEDGESMGDAGEPDDMGTGCSSDGECAPGFCAAGTCVECRDGSDCGAEAPVCAAGTCGDCRSDEDCLAHPDTPICAGGACMGCAEDADCTDPAMARCDLTTGRCAPCDEGIQCAGTGLAICASGVCVECTVADESACGDNSCDPATGICTETPRGSVRRCGACLADSECAFADDRCVPMQLMGGAREGGYCLKPLSTGCVEPYAVPTEERASLSGAAPQAYCGIREDLTTCEAVLDLVDNAACTVASDCGVAGVDDGRCEIVNGLVDRCTYGCDTASECPGSMACGGAEMYCGAP